LPIAFFLWLFAMVVVYLVLVEVAKTRFYRAPHARSPRSVLTGAERVERGMRRRAARYVHHPSPGTG
jgi:hypothetical protein